MIPQGQYDPQRAQGLLQFLIQELRRTQTDRRGLEEFWVHCEEIYRARPAEETKTFPFDGASNLVVGVAATDVDTLYSRMAGLLFDQPGLWAAQAKRPELVDFAEASTEFLAWAQDNEIKPYRDVGNWLIELHKLGTGVLKQRYVRDMRKVYEWREVAQGQSWEKQAIVMMQDHPAINHVRLHDFFIPAGYPTIAGAPWTAERVRLNWNQFMNRVKSGVYMGADRVGASFFNPYKNQVQSRLDQISGYTASINDQLELYEFWLDYDIDGDGWDEALVCTVHLESETYVRLDYNPWFNQEKPYSSACFMRDVNSFYGIGLCEMLDHYQEEITAMHNQRIDSGTVGNSAMFAVKRSNMNIREREPIYPTKIWRVDDPSKDIVRLPLGTGDAVSQSVEMEQATRAEATRRTGVNDFVQGNPGPSSAYGTAYSNQQIGLNATKRLGETLREVNAALGESGTRVFELYQQFFPGGKPYTALGQKDGQMVDMLLRMPLDLIRKGLKITVAAIDAENSKDGQIRTTMVVFTALQQYYQNYMQMLSYAANPGMPEAIKQVALHAAQGSSVLMKRLLQLYDVQDYAQMLPDLDGGMHEQQQSLQNIQAILQSASMGGGGPAFGAQPGAGGAGLGAPQAAGMAGLLGQGTQGVGGPSAGAPPGSYGPGGSLQGAGPAGGIRPAA